MSLRFLVAAALLLPAVASAQVVEDSAGHAVFVETTAGEGSFSTLPPTPAPDALEAMSLEQLLDVDLKVFSASKRAEDVAVVPAAIYAVTNDEIHRAGATTLPETLRVVPGLEVARFNDWTWAISARGFSGEFNNKMLALIDGRDIYSPLFGGVFWDVQDTVLEDIEQIEVIRGPGGTLWGANAVNGVINVTTKSAEQTQGVLVSAIQGSEERFRGTARYGGHAGNLYYRVYGKYFDMDSSVNADGTPARDSWNGGRGGFRAEWHRAPGSVLLLEGDAYANAMATEVSEPIPDPPYFFRKPASAKTSGANVVARWNEAFSGSSHLQVQTYWDHTQRNDPRGNEVRDTGDLDVQESLRLGTHDDLVAGVGVRSTTQEWKDNEFVQIAPLKKTDVFFNAYAQDELRLFDERLHLIAGSKFEHNPFTGFEVQPTARVAWMISSTETAWAAVSRAVRTPARIERDASVLYGVVPGPIYAYVVGNPDLHSMELLAGEGGWRKQFLGRISVDLAVFHNQYSSFLAVNPANAGAPTQNPDGTYKVEVPFSNEKAGRVYGSELSARWVVTPQLTTTGSWTHTETKLSAVGQNNINERPAPKDQANLRVYASVTDAVDWTLAVYWTDTTGLSTGIGAAVTPAWARMDTGLMIRPRKNIEVALWGQNLLDEHHAEITNDFLFRTSEVERSFYGRVTLKF